MKHSDMKAGQKVKYRPSGEIYEVHSVSATGFKILNHSHQAVQYAIHGDRWFDPVSAGVTFDELKVGQRYQFPESPNQGEVVFKNDDIVVYKVHVMPGEFDYGGSPYRTMVRQVFDNTNWTKVKNKITGWTYLYKYENDAWRSSAALLKPTKEAAVEYQNTFDKKKYKFTEPFFVEVDEPE